MVNWCILLQYSHLPSWRWKPRETLEAPNTLKFDSNDNKKQLSLLSHCFVQFSQFSCFFSENTRSKTKNLLNSQHIYIHCAHHFSNKKLMFRTWHVFPSATCERICEKSIREEVKRTSSGAGVVWNMFFYIPKWLKVVYPRKKTNHLLQISRNLMAIINHQRRNKFHTMYSGVGRWLRFL